MNIKMISKDGKIEIESHPSNVEARLKKGWKLVIKQSVSGKPKTDPKDK